MGILRKRERIRYLGVYSNFLQDYGFKERRPAHATFLKTRPDHLPDIVADEMLPGPLTSWRYSFSSHDEKLSEEIMGELPYRLLRESIPMWGWVIEKVKDESVRISHEGRPYHIVFGFEYEDELYCTSWIVDYSGFVHDDSESDIALMQLNVGDAALLLFANQGMHAVPFLGLGVTGVV